MPRLVHLALMLILVSLAATRAGAAELRITGEELAAMLQTSLQGTVVHLDAGPPGKAATSGASWLQMGPRLGGRKYVFSLPAKDVRLGPGMGVRYSISDINSNPFIGIVTPEGVKPFGPNIRVRSTGSALVITLRFEDAGTELKGKPTGRLGRLARGMLRDIEVDNTLLQIQLHPRAATHGLSFAPATVLFSADIQAGGIARISNVDLLDELTDYKRTIKLAVEREVKKQIDASLPAIGAELTREIRRRAATFGAQVSSVRFDGTDLIVTGTPVLR